MTEKQIKLVVGSLLHDIGKVVYRSGDGRNHSQSGYEYLKNEARIQDAEILDCVRFHHGSRLRGARLKPDALAYLAYYGDNLAAAADRREREEGEGGFDKKVPLESVFNILNGNQGSSHYARRMLNPQEGIIYPTEEEVEMDSCFYQKVIGNITDNLKGITYSEEYINSLLSVLEANLSYIPSSTAKKELTDISLYDHLKITAAIALCVERYLESEGRADYRKELLEKAGQAYGEKMFLLYAMDISGIQNFIYTISTQGVVKGLRARSFYLEILMEHMIDELLESLSLCRANLIYSGGGHCYLLLPNTEEVLRILAQQEKYTNQWFLDTFGISLYVAGGFAPCSGENLRNEPKGSNEGLYQGISAMISGKKLHRYGAAEIIRLNEGSHKGERECSVCHRMEQLNGEGRCPVCAALEKMSGAILSQDFFVVIREKEEGALQLPGEKYLVPAEKRQLISRMEGESYVRSYTKNQIYTGKHVTTKLWIGDYTTGDSFGEFAQKSRGIQRIGVLRADVDNLGTAFVCGFKRPDGDDRYATLSRTATLSRQLSLFFKGYINKLLAEGKSAAFSGGGKRNVAIIYSGGDDLFLVGAWNEVIDAFMDLHSALSRFTQGTLTISGGIGLYPPGYPISVMARETASLEECAKRHEGKNAVTLFHGGHTYGWDEFIHDVMREKFQAMETYFDVSQERGKAFLYHLLELLRNDKEKINTARYVYLLSRMEPEENSSKEERDAYCRFSGKMYEWRKDSKARGRVITAMYLYAYLTRDKEENQ